MTVESTVYIASAANRSYLPYFGVMASSILEHNNSGRNICFLLLTSDICERDLAKYFGPSDRRNLNINLLDMSELYSAYQDLRFEEGFPLETVYRLGLPMVVPDEVNRVLYLDGDLVALQDVTPLFDSDLGGRSLAAVLDIGVIGMVHGADLPEAERLSSIGIAEPDNYFSAGVMVWDVSKVGKKLPLSVAMEWICLNKPRYCDQDCLNYFFQNDVELLDMKWNVLFDSNDIRVSDIASKAPSNILNMYINARQHPAIFHFAGPDKPWKDAVDGSTWFWECARTSPAYEYVVAALGSAQAVRLLKENFDSVWKTFDDLYFRSSEAERIRHDLHVRLTDVEKQYSACLARLNEVEEALSSKDSEIASLRRQIDGLWSLRGFLRRLTSRVKVKIKSESHI